MGDVTKSRFMLSWYVSVTICVYKDTALEIAGKCIIKSGYCMLLLKVQLYISVLLQCNSSSPSPPPPPPPNTHNIRNRSHYQYLVDFIFNQTCLMTVDYYMYNTSENNISRTFNAIQKARRRRFLCAYICSFYN